MQLRLRIRHMLQWAFASYFNFMWWNYGLQTGDSKKATSVRTWTLWSCCCSCWKTQRSNVDKKYKYIFKQLHWIAIHSVTSNTRICNSENIYYVQICVFHTCAGHHLGQLLELPNTRPCDHGKAWARTLQRENLGKKNNFAKRANKPDFWI